ncbi:hypothetical protein IHE44_0010186 [Lamprotornis superbus]|uniref:Uncharacterized protein n=1 Tax=Lamprotornis superbus TaxID=245042 RepID=A0A835NGB9_9PASS|nr:hypothetical protein IHE44_0010186 [Lamprotornis superbus]
MAQFSRCSIDEYNQFLQDGGGSCLFNKPLKVPAPPAPRGVNVASRVPRAPATAKVLVLNSQGGSLGVLPFPGDVMPFWGARSSSWLRGPQQLSWVCVMFPPRSRQLLDPPECGNGFVEAGEECDCGSLAVSRVRGLLPQFWGAARGLMAMIPAAVLAGVCEEWGKLLQEVHPDPRRHVQRWALLQGLQDVDPLRSCPIPDELGLCPGQYEPRGVSCREAVNECDIPETCTGDSSQCPPNLHKLDGYFCENEQGRCYGGRCKTRDRQCNALWGRSSAERFCYEKLNVEGTERGNCGREGLGWLQCNKQDVLCGFLLCANISGSPRLGELSGEIATTTFYHQNRYVTVPPWAPPRLQLPGSRCHPLWLSWHRGGHVQLVDGSDLSYVEDGTPCGPGMLCLDRKCLPATAFNFSSCPGSWDGKICFDHGVRGAVGTGGHPGSVTVAGGDAVLSQVCSNEGKCICRAEWTGKDCSVYDPIPEPKPTGETERYKGHTG